MTDRILRMPPTPTYDPDSGKNPFAWIVAAAAKVKAERQAAMHWHRLTNRS